MRTYDVEQRDLAEQQVAVERATLTVPEIARFLGTAYREVAAFLCLRGTGPAGPPFARFHRVGADRFEVEAGFPSAGGVAAADRVDVVTLPGGKAARTVHVGPYDEMEPAYAALTAWVRAHGGEPVGDPWEVYYSDPDEEPDPATWRTEVVQPYRVPPT